jgi:hypothetical protein
METMSLLFGLVDIKYPTAFLDLDSRMNIPFMADMTISIPKIVFKTLFYLGLASSIYYLYRLLGRGKT